jgi:two-component system cell cycle response regulator DivK
MPAPDGIPLVLLVEDTEDSRELYEQALSVSGFRVEVAVDGLEAIEKAKGLKPDVIVMDLSLPRLDGWDATRRIKRHPDTKDIPVIALSGHVVEQSKQKAFAAGCTGYLTKPCRPEMLVAEIRRLL